MLKVKFAANSFTSLAAAIDSTQNSLFLSASVLDALDSGEYYYLDILDKEGFYETVRVTALDELNSAKLYIARAQGGTVARSFVRGSVCGLRISTAAMNDILTFINTARSDLNSTQTSVASHSSNIAAMDAAIDDLANKNVALTNEQNSLLATVTALSTSSLNNTGLIASINAELQTHGTEIDDVKFDLTEHLTSVNPHHITAAMLLPSMTNNGGKVLGVTPNGSALEWTQSNQFTSANWSKILQTSDTTIQKVLDRLDAHNHILDANSLAYDLHGFLAESPEENTTIATFLVTRPFSLFANFASSIARTTNTVNETVTFYIRLNGSAVGSFAFAIGTQVAVWSTTGPISCKAGDVLEVCSGTTVLSNLTFCICGQVDTTSSGVSTNVLSVPLLFF